MEKTTERFGRLVVIGLLAGVAACQAPDGTAAPMQQPASMEGEGVPAFEVDPNWPILPEGYSWGQVIGIYADSRGHVWTSSRSQIAEWDTEGNMVQTWPANGPDGNWSTIHGLFVDHEGNVWTNARESDMTLKFSPTGEHLLTIGRFEESGGSNDTELLGRPAEIWVDAADNEVFVADGYGNRRVIVFDGATGEYLRHWGAYGNVPEDPQGGGRGGGGGGGDDAEVAPPPVPQEPPSQLRVVHGVTGSNDGLIYVADRANNRIQVFQQDGEFVMERILRPRCGVEEQATWTPERECGTEATFSIGFSPDPEQTYLYSADGGSHKITVLRRSDLEILYEFGQSGFRPGELGRPHNLSVDPMGNIYVAEGSGEEFVGEDTGIEYNTGYRAQKFRFVGMRPLSELIAP